MGTDFIERRRHIRVYFEGYEEMRCRIIGNSGQEGELQASVLDISLGGIHIAVDGEHPFRAGDKLTLMQLSHQRGSACTQQVVMEIRWVFARQDFDKVYVGCQFLDLPAENRAFISSLIAEKIRQKKGSHPA